MFAQKLRHKNCITSKSTQNFPLFFCTLKQLHTIRTKLNRNGCATSEDLFWKLDALQSFIRDLHWPDAEFRQHLEQRLKLMACEMIESCLSRTEQSFQSWLKKSVTFISTDYIISTEMCSMVNVILDAKNQSFKLCSVDGIDVVSDCFNQGDVDWFSESLLSSNEFFFCLLTRIPTSTPRTTFVFELIKLTFCSSPDNWEQFNVTWWCWHLMKINFAKCECLSSSFLICLWFQYLSWLLFTIFLWTLTKT